MSSMSKIAFVIPLVIGSAALGQLAQTSTQAPVATAAATNAAYDINYSLADWRTCGLDGSTARETTLFRQRRFTRLALHTACLIGRRRASGGVHHGIDPFNPGYG